MLCRPVLSGPVLSRPAIVLVVVLPALLALARRAPAVELVESARGTVRFEPAAREADIPEAFRLAAHEFAFETRLEARVSPRLRVDRVTFPSPVETPHAANNTVHCEYFQPLVDGEPPTKPGPGVVVLHILGGDFALSRLLCNALAQRGVGALFLKMPYYGERRAPDNPRRMISPDPAETVEAMRQAVLDIRRAAAWLASRREIDAERLGILGVSLGGITGVLAAAAEPRLARVCLVLAGGDLGKLDWKRRELAGVLEAWQARGRDPAEFHAILRQIDPVEHAPRLKGRRVLMLNADRDELIPKACAEALWEAAGNPEIGWYPGGHYTVAWQFFRILPRAVLFLAE